MLNNNLVYTIKHFLLKTKGYMRPLIFLGMSMSHSLESQTVYNYSGNITYCYNYFYYKENINDLNTFSEW